MKRYEYVYTFYKTKLYNLQKFLLVFLSNFIIISYKMSCECVLNIKKDTQIFRHLKKKISIVIYFTSNYPLGTTIQKAVSTASIYILCVLMYWNQYLINKQQFKVLQTISTNFETL